MVVLNALERAIEAVRKHIKYYEGLGHGHLNAMATVVKLHETRLAAPPLLAAQESAFNASVKKALADSPSKRQAQLENASRVPLKVQATTEVYLRNADVAAEVLYRAAGNASVAASPLRLCRKDGTPYLEVHHRKQLADCGETRWRMPLPCAQIVIESFTTGWNMPSRTS